MWVYKQSEHWNDERGYTHELFTVGFYDPSGKWHAESDHPKRDDAAERVHWLDGGKVEGA